MMVRKRLGWIGAVVLLSAAMAGEAMANHTCRNSGTFEQWMARFRQEAQASGISPATISRALDGVTYDANVIRRDHGQGVFQQSFLQFADRMANRNRLQNGLAQLKKNAQLFARIEQQFGVPPAVIVAFWGLETDYGAEKAQLFPVLRSMATLAYDCRRADYFRQQLLDALRIVQRGDLRPDQMLGQWAGELGPTQFTPSDYYKYGVDFDGDGRVDMVHSVPDALASAANLMKGFGWQRGQPWLQEVRVPTQLPWESVRPRRAASALAMGAMGRHRRERQAAGRQPAGLAAFADGPQRSGLPRLSEFQGLSAVERGDGLCDHGGLFRHAVRGRAAYGTRQCTGHGADARPGEGAAAASARAASL